MTSENTLADLRGMAARMRRTILDTAVNAGARSAHMGGALSMVDILATLYGAVMKYRANEPEWPGRDRFILSKGHACLGYYAALSELGVFPAADLMTFEQTGGYLWGHPVINRARGIEFSNGSLGMGLSLGIGVALAARKRGDDTRVFVVLGDGECNEGSVWEAAMAATHFGLSNLTAIIDRNGLQQTGTNDQIMRTGDMAQKWAGFGWDTIEVDGHDVGQLLPALTRRSNGPTAIVARTVKGKGVSFMENNNDWHHNVLTRAQYDSAVAELAAP